MFQCPETMIHEVSHEKVIGLKDLPTHTEQILEVTELSRDVTIYCDWQLHPLHIALFYHDLSCLSAQDLDFTLLDDLRASKCQSKSLVFTLVPELGPPPLHRLEQVHFTTCDSDSGAWALCLLLPSALAPYHVV